MNKLNDEYFKERTSKLLKQFPHHYGEDIEKAIYILLKEVARDVRHACAEAIITMKDEKIYADKGTNSPYEAYVIAKNQAHNACMNV